jgi:hypothetical protein
VEWLTITSSGGGAGNDTVAYRLAANGGGVRIGTITIGDRTHTVTQQERAATPSPPTPTPPTPPTPGPPTPPGCTYTINPTSQAIAAGGGAGQVTVTTTGTCAWTAASNDGWLTVTSGAAGAGNGTVGFTAAANGGAARNGTVTIADRTFTVSQAAAAPPPPPPPPACTYQINPTSASLPVLGGTGSFSISTGSGCAWTATNSASWISFTTATSGSGNGTIGFLVLPNIGSARSSAIAIAGLSFTISQDAVLPSQ